ncbi:hypothetical protein Pint_24914 [Pistacia integerrima]|uniref:Uncharacterized protein n=1 Tax=Pistacia integerrima TaxID=434235 RepID=A0ACC0YBV5_9ROSI|nr:hypothetical protein Pint_24914 [Pistacia integerrima]
MKTCLFNLILFLQSNFGLLPQSLYSLVLTFEGFGMALFEPFLQSLKPSAIPTLFLSKTQISTIITHSTSSVSVSVSPTSRYPSLKRSCSTTNSTSSMESDASSSTGVFIKGLPESTTEGRLKKAFSQFGEVVQVKIVVEKKLKQSLGSAFVWFTNKDSAELAIKEMNGEFFDGRFILVKIAEPGLSKSKGRVTPYKF